MRKLAAGTFLTMDGVLQAPGEPDEDRDGQSAFTLPTKCHGGCDATRCEGAGPAPATGMLI